MQSSTIVYCGRSRKLSSIEEQESLLREFLKRHWLILVLAGDGVICTGYGMLSLLPEGQKSEEMTFQTTDTAQISKLVQKKEIVVDVEGAVEEPGVYHLEADARIQDAVKAA